MPFHRHGRLRGLLCARSAAGLNGTATDGVGVRLGGADHYHRDDFRPAWAVGRKPIRTIGRHLFYRLGCVTDGG